MSNEPNPASSSLRLKPRLRPAQEPGASPTASESGVGVAVQVAPPAATANETAVAVAEAPAMPSVRLRPKLQPAAPVPVPAPQPASDKPLANAVKPSAPPLFAADSPPVAPTPAAPPPPPAASAPAAAVVGDPGKFKLKPKVPGAPAAGSPPVPPLFLPADAPAPPPGRLAPVPPAAAPGATGRPAAPAAADPADRQGKITPPAPVPFVKVDAADLVPEVDLVVRPPTSGRAGAKKTLVVIALLALAGYGAYWAWPHLPAEIAVAGYTIRTKPGFTITKARVATAVSLPTPSETLNKLAQMPGNAIDKAQDALAARRASGQDRVDAAAVGEDLPGKSFGVPPAAPIKPPPPPPKAPASPTAVTTVAPGMSAPVSVEAAPEAAPEFRAFVTKARISGIFQGNPARAVINGKLSRTGEVVDPGLGITFEGLDAGRKSLVFKDRSGATVTRRF